MYGTWIARSGDGLILLDLDADSYACIYDPSPDALNEKANDCLAEDSDQRASNGISALLTPQAHWSQCRWRGADWRDPESIDSARPSIREGLYFLLALGIAALAFRRRPVRDLLRHIQNLSPPQTQDGHHSPAIVAAQFEQFCLFLPFRMQCLFRSFFLLHFLRLQGFGADWVFGAGLFPFRAHCWLAIDSHLVGERSHLIESYEPLFTLKRHSA